MEMSTADSEDDDDDIILITSLEDCIVHKPNESKYDTLSGIIPFEDKVSFFRFFLAML